MWPITKYFMLLAKLMSLLGELQAVKAHAPETTAESYAPAAAVIVGDPGVAKLLSRLTPTQQKLLGEGLPLTLWMLDYMTE